MRGVRIFVAMLVSFLAAQSASAAMVWKYDVIVQRVQVGGNGNFIMYLPSGTGPTCQENGTLFRVNAGSANQDAEGVKATLAGVLLAFSMARPVSFAYDDATCTVAGVVIN